MIGIKAIRDRTLAGLGLAVLIGTMVGGQATTEKKGPTADQVGLLTNHQGIRIAVARGQTDIISIIVVTSPMTISTNLPMQNLTTLTIQGLTESLGTETELEKETEIEIKKEAETEIETETEDIRRAIESTNTKISTMVKRTANINLVVVKVDLVVEIGPKILMIKNLDPTLHPCPGK